ncbi:unnamed protein product [Lupinus luteus]|uniref:DUF4283 domain-containing protein n=1 Tax=Lupinus luteus TaxID=3873 RepID=A0AAV1YIF0_LUPLU
MNKSWKEVVIEGFKPSGENQGEFWNGIEVQVSHSKLEMLKNYFVGELLRAEDVGLEDQEEMLEVINLRKDWVCEIFINIRRGTPQEVAKERLTWVKVFGVPLQACNASFFSMVAGLHGRFIRLDENTRDMKILDVGLVLILTSSKIRIEHTFPIKVGDLFFDIRVVEEDQICPSNSIVPMSMEKEEEDSVSVDNPSREDVEWLEDVSAWEPENARDEDEDDVDVCYSKMSDTL